MALVCSISGEVPENPVVSPYGHIYERRLVEKFIDRSGTDPVTGQALTKEQLIDIKASPLAKPRPANSASIPGLCKMMLDEWDAVMLALFTERKQHAITKQELSHTLYQHDSASRVIARFQREVMAAREALATLKPQAVASGLAAPALETVVEKMDFDNHDTSPQDSQVFEAVIERLQGNASLLTDQRKKKGKTVPEGLATPDDIKNYRQTASHSGLHSVGEPGITAIDVCPGDTSKIVTGGNDGNAVIFNKNSETIVAVLKGHSKGITSVVHHPNEDLVCTGSLDSTVRVWGVERSSPCAHVIKAHDRAVTGLSLHAVGDYLLSCSSDGFWGFSDLRTGQVITKKNDETSYEALTCGKFHPDGMIFGIGTDKSVVKIWDLKELKNVANFTGHEGAVTSIAFSENGYYLATAAKDPVVKLWDLRKLKNFKNITLEENYKVESLAFDQSGSYLAVGGTDVRIYLSKQWTELAVFNDHTAAVTGMCFGESASFLTSVSMDRSLKIFSL